MQDIDELYIRAASEGNVEQLKDIDKKHQISPKTATNALLISMAQYKPFRYLVETHHHNIPKDTITDSLNGLLYFMVEAQDIDGIKWAIGHGANPSASQSFAKAVMSGDIEIIDTLLSVPLAEDFVTIVAFFALQKNNQAIIDHLMTDRLYQDRRPDTTKLAFMAAHTNDLHFLRRIVDTYDVDVTAENNTLFKSLIDTLVSVEIFKYLEEKGANPEDKLNDFVINFVKLRSSQQLLHFLKKYDIDPNLTVDDEDMTLLHRTALWSPKICETLINLGADPFRLSNGKKNGLVSVKITPMFYAVASKNKAILDVFLKLGGHLSPCKPEKSTSALDAAFAESWPEGAEEIRKANMIFTKQLEHIAKIDFSALKTMDDFRQVQIEREPSSTGGFGIKASGLVAALFSEDTDAFFEKLAGFGPGCLKPEDADLSVRVDNGHTSFKADLTDIILEKKVVSKLFDERLWTAKPAEMTEFFDALPKKLQDQAQDEYKRSLSSLRLKNKVASNPGHKLKLRRRSPGR